MKKRLLVLLTVLLVLAACTPGAFAYDVAAEQAADFGTASLESALPEQAYDAFGELSVADAAQPQSLLACLLYTSPSPRDQRGSRMPSSA